MRPATADSAAVPSQPDSRRSAVEELRHSAVLEMVVRASQLGLWDWDIATGAVAYSREWKRQLGYEDGEISDRLEEWTMRLHPEDRPRMQHFIDNYLASPPKPYEAEFRLQHRDGSWRWIRAYAELVRDEQGRPVRMFGSHVDITDFKRVEAAQRRANRLWRLRSEVSAATVRAVEEAALLNEVCTAVVTIGGFARAAVTPYDSGGQALLGAEEISFGSIGEGGPILQRPLFVGSQPLADLVIWAVEGEEVSEPEQTALTELAADVGLALEMIRTRRQRDEVMRALRRSRARLAEAERIARVGCWEWERTGGRLYWSDEMFHLLGLDPQKIAPDWAHLLERVHPEDRPHVQRVMTAEDLRSGTTRESELRLIGAAGNARHLLARATVLGGATGEAILFGTLQDITSRKQAEDALRDNMRRVLRQEAALLALTRPDPEAQGDLRAALWRLTEASARALDVARVSFWRFTDDRQAIECVDLYELPTNRHSAGMKISAAAHGRYFGALSESEVLCTDDARADQRTAEFTAEYLQPLGIVAMMDVPIRLKSALHGVLCHEHLETPRTWTAEERTFALAISNLVTLALEEDARRQAQKERERTEQAYAALVSSVDGIVWEVELPSYRFTYVSPQAERLLGYPVETWLEEPEFWTNRMHPEDRTWAPAFCVRATEAGQDHEFYYRMHHADGRVVWLHDLVTLVMEDGVPRRLRGIMVDVTEQKRAEQALHAREQEYRALVENSPDIICRYGRDGRILYVNPSCERLMSGVRGNPIGQRGIDTMPEHAGLRRFYAQVEEVVRTGVPSELELELDFLSVTDPPLHYIRLVPERDPQGQVVSVLGIGRDITAIRRTERQLRESEERFRQSQKMEAIGRLAGGIAHDFNNLLAVIRLQSDLLTGEGITASALEGVEQIKAAADRASALTRQLLTFSRRGMPQVRELDLAEVTRSMATLLQRVLGEDIALESRFSPTLPRVKADAGMIEQVIMNLAVNARDAMPQGGRLTIELQEVTADAERVASCPGVEAGRFVCLAVTDTGTGIAPDVLPHVFEPFFTTKELGRGTGLGLSTVFGIAQQHGGWVEAANSRSGGAVLRFFVPALAHASVPAASGPDAVVHPPRGSECILVVEDDPLVRPLACGVLQRFGYRVLSADSGVAALDLWDKRGSEVNLLLTDLVMPGGVGGLELAERLRRRRPTLKVVTMSGYSTEMAAGGVGMATAYPFLAKPFSVDSLLQTVRTCLDEAVDR